MKIRDIIAPVEEFAPLGLQEEYDNSGLIVGSPETEIDRALVCVDVTPNVVDEAIELGAGLIISHHPAIFHPLKRLTGECVITKAVKNDIALYSAHTNLDRAQGGMSHRLAEVLGINDVKPLAEFGVIGNLPRAVESGDFLRTVKEKLDIEVIRHNSLPPKVHKIALCTGSGRDLIEAAQEQGADIYLSAELKYNDFFSPVAVADIGHWESEFCAIELICDIISKKIANFALYKSRKGRNPVCYYG